MCQVLYIDLMANFSHLIAFLFQQRLDMHLALKTSASTLQACDLFFQIDTHLHKTSSGYKQHDLAAKSGNSDILTRAGEGPVRGSCSVASMAASWFGRLFLIVCFLCVSCQWLIAVGY
jgi:hypothetical protein